MSSATEKDQERQSFAEAALRLGGKSDEEARRMGAVDKADEQVEAMFAAKYQTANSPVHKAVWESRVPLDLFAPPPLPASAPCDAAMDRSLDVVRRHRAAGTVLDDKGKVSPAVLIPRPETEMIITLLKELLPAGVSLLRDSPKKLVDIGTGSCILGITAKLEFPECEVTLCDISTHALNVAKANAKMLGADVTTLRSDLLADYPLVPDIILANLPYVDKQWDLSPETEYEPAVALFAENKGLHLIEKLVAQAGGRLRSGGLVLLEADPRQHAAIVKLAKNHGFAMRETRGFIVVLEKL